MFNNSILSKINSFWNKIPISFTIIFILANSIILMLLIFYSFDIFHNIIYDEDYQNAYKVANKSGATLSEQYNLLFYAAISIPKAFIKYIYKDSLAKVITLLQVALFCLLYKSISSQCIIKKTFYCIIPLSMPILLVILGIQIKGIQLIESISKNKCLNKIIENIDNYVQPETLFILFIVYILFLIAKTYQVINKARSEFIQIYDKKQLEQRISQREQVNHH